MIAQTISGPEAAFRVIEMPAADDRIDALFRKSFGSPAPTMPRHFAAFANADPTRAAGYVHYTAYEPGVFLLGGLCVDSAIYRLLSDDQRQAIAGAGSLSRWLMQRSIAALGERRAIFGYTGDVRTRRDSAALGFVRVREPYLFAQWHDAPEDERDALVARVAALGPF